MWPFPRQSSPPSATPLPRVPTPVPTPDPKMEALAATVPLGGALVNAKDHYAAQVPPAINAVWEQYPPLTPRHPDDALVARYADVEEQWTQARDTALEAVMERYNREHKAAQDAYGAAMDAALARIRQDYPEGQGPERHQHMTNFWHAVHQRQEAAYLETLPPEEADRHRRVAATRAQRMTPAP